MDDFPLTDEIDHEILMHRDAHFGGSFEIMLDYYQKDGKGVNPEFEPSRIQELALIERTMGQDLSEIILLDYEKERVDIAKRLYITLRDLYEKKPPEPKIVADLVLSEDEEPTEEIKAVVALKTGATSSLLTFIKNEEWYDPLSPGYGTAPALAAECLGLIGNERAIIPLFQAMGKEDFFTEEAIIDALHLIGDKAKAFLLKALTTLPPSKDNQQAAIALLSFREDPVVAKACLRMLIEHHTKLPSHLMAYLILGCEGLVESADRKSFVDLSDSAFFDKDLKKEMQEVVKIWKSSDLKSV